MIRRMIQRGHRAQAKGCVKRAVGAAAASEWVRGWMLPQHGAGCASEMRACAEVERESEKGSKGALSACVGYENVGVEERGERKCETVASVH